MDVGGIFGKIESNAETLGALIGGLSAIHSHSWGKDIPTGIRTIVEQLAKDPHIPDLGHVWEAVTNSEFFMPSLIALVGGYAMEAIDLDPRIERAGRAFKKAGFGALLGGIAVNVLIYSGAGHSNSGGGGSATLESVWGGR